MGPLAFGFGPLARACGYPVYLSFFTTRLVCVWVLSWLSQRSLPPAPPGSVPSCIQGRFRWRIRRLDIM